MSTQRVWLLPKRSEGGRTWVAKVVIQSRPIRSIGSIFTARALSVRSLII